MSSQSILQDAGGPDVAPVARVRCRRADVGGGKRGRMSSSSMRSRRRPGRRWRRGARGRTSPGVGRCLTGVQRTWTLRKNTMPVGPQYSRVFGNTSGSMNGLQVWPAPNCAQLAHRRGAAGTWSALVDAGAEQLELERGLEVAPIGRVDEPDAEAALATPGERVCRPRRTGSRRPAASSAQGVEPVGVDLLEVVADVEHREAVDLEGGPSGVAWTAGAAGGAAVPALPAGARLRRAVAGPSRQQCRRRPERTMARSSNLVAWCWPT